ncbi:MULTISPECIES: YoaK family protein [Alphaproteobacteria]|uniref:DUF1275 family protein n=2 Tax=Alphaproteobacteria TaxID=28211 RepID=A0A512HL26_9HYPH|nr:MULTISPECIES: YoaK family protein [Alphaproteobacteria]GEO86143.1 DUF1275 family protein [Ciceribacter naphthalenivorans]GLR22710.1 DUF1275 family protein [Ciceribacter naphthalenivorans]GLT05566.1 DUF1275 family protein [Sphingomonas psychrolutea]
MKYYLGGLAARERNEKTNRHLAFYLTFVAGAVNAGGFMAVGQYTSHMSGIVSAIADNMVLGKGPLVVIGVSSLSAFIAGAATSAILINWARRRALESEYALPLAVEALLLLIFALSDLVLVQGSHLALLLTIGLLCFIMGLQNAIITKLSGARIRTTHVTGLVTDAGIEIGKLFYHNAPARPDLAPVIADRRKLALLLSLIGLFFSGGIAGALLFSHFGLPVAAVFALPLGLFASFPIVADLKSGRPHRN